MIETRILEQQAEAYAEQNGLDGIVKRLGQGQDGFVAQSGQDSAIKVFEREKTYYTELKCYEILDHHGIDKIEVFNVPKLIDWDGDLKVIEMTMVSAPFILDFGKAHFQPHDFSEEVMQDHDARFREDFGDYYELVNFALYELRQLGIYYYDVRCGNINCDGIG